MINPCLLSCFTSSKKGIVTYEIPLSLTVSNQEKGANAYRTAPHLLDKYGMLQTDEVIYMGKTRENKKYTPEFKQKVIEIMQKEGLSYRETARE